MSINLDGPRHWFSSSCKNVRGFLSNSLESRLRMEVEFTKRVRTAKALISWRVSSNLHAVKEAACRLRYERALVKVWGD